MTTKITERMLLDGYSGMTGGMDWISTINGKEIRWNYRHDTSDDDGYDCVADRDKANHITLEWDRHGSIEMDPECNNHPTLERMEHDRERLFGTEV